MAFFKPRKVRIQRTKKPWLHGTTTRLFHLGDLMTKVLSMAATYSGNAGREAYEAARTDRTIEDIKLKQQRTAYVRAQTERTHLLNELTRRQLALIPQGALGTPVPPALTDGGPALVGVDLAAPGEDFSAPLLISHACPRCQAMNAFPPTSKDMVEMQCISCSQEWEIYPQGAEVLAQ